MARVTQISLETGRGDDYVELVIDRSPMSVHATVPRVSDLPQDCRQALRDWLDSTEVE